MKTKEEIIAYCQKMRQGHSLVKTSEGYADCGKDVLGDQKWHYRVFEEARETGSDARYGYTFYEGVNLIYDEIVEVEL